MNPFSKPRSRRRALLAIGVLAMVITVVILAARPWIMGKVHSAVRESLQQRGVSATWHSSSWYPWTGLRFKGVQLKQIGGQELPIAKIDRLSFTLPIWQTITGSDFTTSFQIDSAPLTLHDEAGTLSLDAASLSGELRDGKVELHRLRASHDGLKVDLGGTLLTSTASASDSAFQLDLGFLRVSLATLKIKPDTGPFTVTGSFSVDVTSSQTKWSTLLKGEGENLEWNGIRCTRATAEGELVSTGSRIRYNLSTAHGSALGEAARGGSEDAPFIFKGSFEDLAKQSDSYAGHYQAGVLTLESLKGSANLWELAKDVPAFATKRSDVVRFETFPQIELTNLRHRTLHGESKLTLESLTLDNKDPVTFTVHDRSAEAENLFIKTSYKNDKWDISRCHADLFGGGASLSGHYQNGVLSGAEIHIKKMHTAEIQRIVGGGEIGKSGRTSATFQGSIHVAKNEWTGDGSLHMTDTPTVEVPLLDQVYDLFSAMLPGVKRSAEGELDATFKSTPNLVTVESFEARAGSSLTVSARGKINLRDRSVDGIARGKLVGLPGVVTSPLSHLLEMKISGPYNDIRISPLGPAKLASSTASATVGVAVDTLEETGKVIGTVLKEGIKVPFKWLNKHTK